MTINGHNNPHTRIELPELEKLYTDSHKDLLNPAYITEIVNKQFVEGFSALSGANRGLESSTVQRDQLKSAAENEMESNNISFGPDSLFDQAAIPDTARTVPADILNNQQPSVVPYSGDISANEGRFADMVNLKTIEAIHQGLNVDLAQQLPQLTEVYSLPETDRKGDGVFQKNITEIPSDESVAKPSLESYREFYFLKDFDSSNSQTQTVATFDVYKVRRDFPALHQVVNGKPLVWLDNAATTQKPQSVIYKTSEYYQRDNSNIHRGAHTLAARSTDAFENAREKVREFIGADSVQEIVFVRGATEAINLVAQTYGKEFIGKGDEIVVTEMEHHANIVPWQMLCDKIGAVLKIAPINDVGEILIDKYAALLGKRTKLVAFTQVSNVLGTVNPVELMTQMAHAVGAKVLIDGAQSIPHSQINVQTMDCDFFVFSGHKLFGPTGIGVLYGKAELLDAMPPWEGGGMMIDTVTMENTTYNSLPYKFEAGTNNIAGAVGLGAAIDYLNQIDIRAAVQYEQKVFQYAQNALAGFPGMRHIGTAPGKVSVLSFVLDGIPNEEVGRLLDREGIAVRASHHCAQPTMQHYGLTSTVRPSLAFYNTCEEIDVLVEALYKIRKSLGSS